MSKTEHSWKQITKQALVVSGLALGLVACGPGDDALQPSEFAGTISQPTTWSGTVTLTGSVYVESTLTLEPCTTLLVRPNAAIDVQNNGSIRSMGTADCPVMIRSSNNVPAKGDWERIHIYSTSSNDTLLRHTHLHHANGSSYGGLWVDANASVELRNATFGDITGDAIVFEKGANVRGFSDVHVHKVEGFALRVGANQAGKIDSISGEQLGKPAVHVTGDTVTVAATWKDLELPFHVDAFYLDARLELAAGSRMLIAPNVIIRIQNGGSFRALGTAEAPIIIESSKSAPAAGDWGQFEFYSSSANDNLFRHTTVRHGGAGGTYGALWLESGARLSLENSTFALNHTCDVHHQSDDLLATATSVIACN
ncbi:MAG: hypothetical protein H0U74_10560 [Bradymonadaceae bacterium]|nr:hypothetical protein [Lujinxingiaceae bacterium]